MHRMHAFDSFFIQSIAMKKTPLLTLLCAAALVAACTTQEKQDIKELENMPGITCVTNVQGQTHCGPDSLSATEEN